jgi:photosystem II stability/assembly factor-like uncharacterized protein
VFIVRGSVSGSHTGQFGAFVRNGEDSTYALLNPSNVITFGLGYFERGSTRRYYIAGGNGVHRSTDGGKRWRILTSWQTMEILSLLPDPVDSSIIYAATPWGVYKTADDGASWVRKDRGCKRWFVQKLLGDRRDRRTLYAAMEDDLYCSRDGAESWEPLHVGADQIQVVAQNPARPEMLCVGVEDRGIRVSRDNGATWVLSPQLSRETIYALRFSPDGSSLYAAGWKTGLLRSTDGGLMWERIFADDAVESIFDILVNPTNPSHLLVGTDGQGIYESLDHGRTWRRAGLMGAKVKQMEFYP